MVPPWSTFGQKMLCSETTALMESSSARGHGEFFYPKVPAVLGAQSARAKMRTLAAIVPRNSRMLPSGTRAAAPKLRQNGVKMGCPGRAPGTRRRRRTSARPRERAAESTHMSSDATLTHNRDDSEHVSRRNRALRRRAREVRMYSKPDRGRARAGPVRQVPLSCTCDSTFLELPGPAKK